MFDDSDLITVACPHCHRKSEHEIGWLKENAHFRCACGRLLEYNYNNLLEFLRNEAAQAGAIFPMEPSPME